MFLYYENDGHGDVRRCEVYSDYSEYLIVSMPFGDVKVLKGLGNVYLGEGNGMKFYRESPYWELRYMRSLRKRLKEQTVNLFLTGVFYRGKVNSEVLLMDAEGLQYTTKVPNVLVPEHGHMLARRVLSFRPFSMEPNLELLHELRVARAERESKNE